MPVAWEMQPTETSKSYRAFCVYRDLGPGRSLGKAADELGYMDHTTLERWSSKHEWVSRAAAYDAYSDSQALTLRQATLPEVRQQISDDLTMKITALDRLIEGKLSLLTHSTEAGDQVSGLELLRLANVIELSDSLKRRNVGLPTAYRSDTAQEAEDDDAPVYYIGGN